MSCKQSTTGYVHVCISSPSPFQASLPCTGSVFRNPQWTYFLWVSTVFPGPMYSFSICILWQGAPSFPLRVWSSQPKSERLHRSLPFLKEANPDKSSLLRTQQLLPACHSPTCSHYVQHTHLRLIIPCSQLGKAPSSCMTFSACVSLNQRRLAPLLHFLIFASSPACFFVPRTGWGAERSKKLSKGVDWKWGEGESGHESKVKGRGPLKGSLR